MKLSTYIWLPFVFTAGLLTLSQAAPSGSSRNKGKERQAAYRNARRDIKATSAINGRLKRKNRNAMDAFKDIEDAIFNYGMTDPTLIGDIKLLPTEQNILDGQKRRRKRKVSSERFSNRWPGKIIPWAINYATYPAADASFIYQTMRDAADIWESRSCVRFPNRTAESNYIEIINDGGCYSYIGDVSSYFSGGRQPLSIAYSSQSNLACLYTGTIMHEFGHAAGFAHEQSRADRDAQAKMLYGNIDSGRENNFVKQAFGEGLIYSNAPYDASSVMHYSLTGFSRNYAKTISMNNPELDSLAGQRLTASYYDEVAMNRAYDCAEGCPERCENHGYARKVNNICQCICPPYIGGATCTDVATTCGGAYTLSSGQSITVESENYPNNYNREICAYLFKAPSSGHSLRLGLAEIDIRSCNHYLDIRNNLVGQESPYFLCGTSTNVPDFTTKRSVMQDSLLVIFDGSSTSQTANGKYRFTVTAEVDSCVNDPCHGVPCVDDGLGTYRCIYPEYPIHCGFETGVAGPCSALKPNVYFDDTQGAGRRWDISSGAAEGSSHWMAYTDNTGSTQIGTMSIIPTKVGGGVWCLDFQHAVYGSSSGRLNVYTVVNGVKGSLLYTKIGSSSTSKIWERKLVLVDGTSLSGDDMVEVLFEAVTNAFTSSGNVGIDAIRYSPGSCPILSSACASYPCGARACEDLGGDNYRCEEISGDLTCGFEQHDTQCNAMIDMNVSGDNYDPIYNTGGTPSVNTGPSEAFAGDSYVYFEVSGISAGSTAYLKVNALSHTNKIFSLHYHAYGASMGSLSLHRQVNGESPSASNRLATIFTGNQGTNWNYFETEIDFLDIAQSDTVELILVMAMGGDYRSDICIDDIRIRDTTTQTTTTPITTTPTTTTATTTTPTSTTPTTTTPTTTTPTTTTPTTTAPTTTTPTTTTPSTTTPITTTPTTTTPTTTTPTTTTPRTTTPTTTTPTTTTPTTTTPTTTTPTTTTPTTPTTTTLTTTTQTTTTPTTTTPTTTAPTTTTPTTTTPTTTTPTTTISTTTTPTTTTPTTTTPTTTTPTTTTPTTTTPTTTTPTTTTPTTTTPTTTTPTTTTPTTTTLTTTIPTTTTPTTTTPTTTTSTTTTQTTTTPTTTTQTTTTPTTTTTTTTTPTTTTPTTTTPTTTPTTTTPTTTTPTTTTPTTTTPTTTTPTTTTTTTPTTTTPTTTTTTTTPTTTTPTTTTPTTTTPTTTTPTTTTPTTTTPTTTTPTTTTPTATTQTTTTPTTTTLTTTTPTTTTPATTTASSDIDLSCGFETGDDCSWIEKDVPSADTFRETSGPSENTKKGVDGGYLSTFYACRRGSDSNNFAQSALMIKPIAGLGTRCLQFQYNIVSGTLNVELGTGERLWTGKRRAQGYSTAVVALNNINDATEIHIKAIDERKATDLSLDAITYTSGPCV